jgi:hypothetical protein
MKDVEKYLGCSKLTADYKSDFFNNAAFRRLDIRVEKVLKSDDDKIIFLTTQKSKNGKRAYFINVLRRVDGIPLILYFSDKKFETSDSAIEYFENIANKISL